MTVVEVDESHASRAGPLWARAALMAAQIFGIVASFTLTKAVRDAVFLARFAMHSLAYVSLMLAVLAGLAAAAHQRFVAARLSRGNASAAALGFVALTLVAFAALVDRRAAVVPWLLYLWSGVFGLLLVAQFWIMALEVFDPREARRVFAALASGASLGGVVGGLAAKELSDDLGEAGLLLVVAVVLGACAALARAAWGMRPREQGDVSHVPPPPASARADADAAGARAQLAAGLRALRASPLLRTAAVVLLCSIVAGTLLDWQVKAIARAHFGSDRGALTEFFGRVLAYASIAALALQAVTGAVLRRVGVAAGLLVLPVVMLGGALMFVGHGPLGLSLIGGAVLAKTAEGGVRNAIDKAAFELLYIPVQGATRAAGKGLVDTVADRLGGAITAAIWLLLEAGFDVERPERVHVASYVVVGIALVWMAAALRARAHYLDAFKTALSRLELRAERIRGRVGDANQEQALAAALASARAAEVMLALDLLADPQNRRARVDVTPALGHAQHAVRARALEVLAMRRELAPAAAALLADPAPRVRIAAVRWALAVGPARLAARLGAAAPLPPSARRLVEITAMSADARARALGALARSSAPADRAVAAVVAASTHDRALLESLREDPHAAVAEVALAAVAEWRDVRDVPYLLRAAVRPATRGAAVDALARYGPAPALLARLASPETRAAERRAIVDALARTRDPDAVAPLSSALPAAPGHARLAVLKALDKLKRDTDVGPETAWIEAEARREVAHLGRLAAIARALAPAETGAWSDGARAASAGGSPLSPAVLALARRATVEAIDRGVERLFRVLALLTVPKVMRDAYLALRDAPAGRSRATSVEYLDNALPAALRPVIVPIVEPGELDARLAAMTAAADAPPFTAVQPALEALATSDEPWLRTLGAGALQRLGVVPGDDDASRSPAPTRPSAAGGVRAT